MTSRRWSRGTTRRWRRRWECPLQTRHDLQVEAPDPGAAGLGVRVGGRVADGGGGGAEVGGAAVPGERRRAERAGAILLAEAGLPADLPGRRVLGRRGTERYHANDADSRGPTVTRPARVPPPAGLLAAMLVVASAV